MMLILAFILDLLVPLVAARLLRKRTRWSTPRVALTAALPIPLLFAGVALIWISVSTSTIPKVLAPKEQAFWVGIGVAMLYLVGLAVVAATARARSKPSADEIADIFS